MTIQSRRARQKAQLRQEIIDAARDILAREGYAFSATVFFVCCLGMSLYSRQLERRLMRGR